MKGLIFAAGLGTRLHPITLTKPKALVEVGGVPMLGRVISKLKDFGVTDLTVNVFHFANQVIDYIKANNSFGIDIHISDERPTLLDTGGGIVRARRWLEGSEPILIHNADIFTDFDIAHMLAVHESSRSAATLLASLRISSRYLLFDSEGTMQGWTNKSTGEVKPEGLVAESLTPLAFGGVHIISPSILPLLADYGKEVFSIIPFYIDFCKKLRITAHIPAQPYNWIDIGKPESLAIARQLFCSEKSAKQLDI